MGQNLTKRNGSEPILRYLGEVLIALKMGQLPYNTVFTAITRIEKTFLHDLWLF